jgi:hypothetical protein
MSFIFQSHIVIYAMLEVYLVLYIVFFMFLVTISCALYVHVYHDVFDYSIYINVYLSSIITFLVIQY